MLLGKEIVFKVVHFVAPTSDDVLDQPRRGRLGDDLDSLQFSLVISRCVLEFVEKTKHLIVNVVDFSLDMLSRSGNVKQIRDLSTIKNS